MIDGVPNGDGNSRYLKTIASALTQYPTYESFMTALINGTFTVDFNGINQAGWAQIGTALNKANLLTDNTARVLSLGSSATVNNALYQLAYALLTEEVEEEITASGSWTMPYNILDDEVQVLVMGGGGGGGGGHYARVADDKRPYFRSGGGGGAGYVNEATLTLTRGQAYTITIGAGGAGGADNEDGEQGGTTSFGSLLSAEGGKGGRCGGNGTGQGNGGDGSAGGGGGVGGARYYTPSAAYDVYAGGAGGAGRNSAGRNSSGGQGGNSRVEKYDGSYRYYLGEGGFGGNYNGSNGAAGESYVRDGGETHNRNGGVGITGETPGTWQTGASTSNVGGCGGGGYKGLGGKGAWLSTYLTLGTATVGTGYGCGGGGGVYFVRDWDGGISVNTSKACVGSAGTAGICVLKYRRIIGLSEF